MKPGFKGSLKPFVAHNVFAAIMVVLIVFGPGCRQPEISDTSGEVDKPEQNVLPPVTATGEITALLPLRDKIITGTRGGLVSLGSSLTSIEKKYFTPGQSIPYISSLASDQAGKVWIGTSHGLARLEREACRYDPDVLWTIRELVLKDGKLWILGDDLRVTSKNTGPDDAQTQRDHDRWLSPYVFFACDQGGMTDRETRLIGYNTRTLTWDVLSSTLPQSTLHSFCVWNGSLWASAYDVFGREKRNHGLVRFDGKEWYDENTMGLPSAAENHLWTQVITSRNALYAASIEGIVTINESGNRFIPFPGSLDFKGQEITALGVGHGSIWFGSGQTVGFFDGEEWLFRSLETEIKDNSVQALFRYDTTVFIETELGISLVNSETDQWQVESKGGDRKFTVVTTAGNDPVLFRLEGLGAHLALSRRPLDWGSEVHNWEQLSAVPVSLPEITVFRGDHDGNVWLSDSRSLHRHRSGKWTSYYFNLKETFSHKFITVESRLTSEKAESRPGIVVETLVTADRSIWVLVRGAGWHSVLRFSGERWKSFCFLERSSKRISLVAASDTGAWIQEDSVIYFYSGEEKTHFWTDPTRDYVAVSDFVVTGDQADFIVASITGREHKYEIVSFAAGSFSENFKNVLLPEIELTSLCRIDQDMWIGTDQGIIRVRSGVSGQRQDVHGEVNKKVIAQADIKPASVGKPAKLTGLEFPAILPALSPDGSRVAYIHSKGANRSLKVYNFQAGIDETLPDILLKGRMYKPEFSPDGTFLMFYAEEARDEELFRYSFSDHKVTRLTRSRGKDWEPTFCPLNHDIVWTSNRWGNNDIYVMNRNGKKNRRLTTTKSSEWHPTVSPDCSEIVYVKSDSNNPGDLWIMDYQGKDQRPFVTNKGKDWLPDWSPDGKYIAFTSFSGGFHHLYVIDKTTKKQIQLTRGPYNDWAPQWNADGHELIFHSDRSGVREIWTVKIR